GSSRRRCGRSSTRASTSIIWDADAMRARWTRSVARSRWLSAWSDAVSAAVVVHAPLDAQGARQLGGERQRVPKGRVGLVAHVRLDQRRGLVAALCAPERAHLAVIAVDDDSLAAAPRPLLLVDALEHDGGDRVERDGEGPGPSLDGDDAPAPVDADDVGQRGQ